MSANINQVYINNPTTGVIPANTLFYLGLSPYGAANDSAITYANLAISLFTNPNIPSTSSSTVGVINQNGARFIHTYNGNNIFVGGGGGNFTLTGFRNCGYGNSGLHNLTSGSDNVSVGWASGSMTTGSNNTVVGSAATGITTGNYNLHLGFGAGGGYTSSESSNVLLSNDGVNGESHVMRLGTTGSGDGQQTDSYLAGNVHAGTKFIFPSETTIYVNGNTGNDTTGDGSAIYPYATITKANSVILDNATGKRYVIRHTGSTTELNLKLKPWTFIVGSGAAASYITITGTTDLEPDDSWDGLVGGIAGYSNVTFLSSINFNLAAFTGSAATIYWPNVVSNNGILFQGRTSGLDVLNISGSVVPAGGFVATDFSVVSQAGLYDETVFSHSNSAVPLTWSSNSDVFTSTIAVSSGATGALMTMYSSSIAGLVTVGGSTANFSYDPNSYPRGGFSFIASGTATQRNTIQATPIGSITPSSGAFTTLSASTPLPLSSGGTNASLTASNGGIFYSNVSGGAILAGTATGLQMLQSGATAAPSWSAATWPSSTTINQLLYSSAINTVSGITTGNNGVLITSAGGVPSISSTLPAAVQGNITAIGAATASGLFNASAAGALSWTPPGTNNYTGATYTFAASDFNKYCRFSRATAQTITIDTNANVPTTVGTEVSGIQAGVGQVTFVGAGGVTVNFKGGVASISGQFGKFWGKNVATDVWDWSVE